MVHATSAPPPLPSEPPPPPTCGAKDPQYARICTFYAECHSVYRCTTLVYPWTIGISVCSRRPPSPKRVRQHCLPVGLVVCNLSTLFANCRHCLHVVDAKCQSWGRGPKILFPEKQAASSIYVHKSTLLRREAPLSETLKAPIWVLGRFGGGRGSEFSPTYTHICIHVYISLGRTVSCQHGAFSGVGAFVVSFVPAECPVGGGVCGVYSESP